MTLRPVLRKLYPETRAAPFTRHDHRLVFFSRLNALLRPDMTVLDYGAGRGRFSVLERGFIRELALLKGKVARVIGVDLDSAVLSNPDLDEALVTEAAEPIDLPDESVDLVVSFAVLEHVEHPEFCARDLSRVLKRGGWFCAYTPNKWGYSSVFSRLIPDRFHTGVLRRLVPSRDAQDSFPTYFRMNTRRRLERLFPPDQFEHMSYYFNGPPGYDANLVVLANVWRLYTHFAPPFLASGLHVFIRKRE